MSKKHNVLVGGTIAGLVLSLALPISSNSGSNSPNAAHAGVGPKSKFSKPWKQQYTPSLFSKLRFGDSVKSYPIPDELKEENLRESEPESDSPEVVAPTNLKQELEAAYSESDSKPEQKQNSSSFPVVDAEATAESQTQSGTETTTASNSGELPVQTAAARKQTRPPKQKKRYGGLLGRLFNRSKSPEPQPELESPPENVVRNGGAPETSVQPDAAFPVPETIDDQNAPVADVIIPPQPMPNLLPGMDFSKPDAIAPVVTDADTDSATNDPFPLPPLPDGFNTAKKSTAKADTESQPVAEVKSPAIDLDSLPLPGISSEIKKPAKTETATLAAPPFPPAAQLKTAESSDAPTVTEPAVMAPTLPVTPPAVVASKPMEVASPQIVAETTEPADPMMDTTVPHPLADAAVESDVAQQQAPAAKGELGNSLPLAPSATASVRPQPFDSPAARPQTQFEAQPAQPAAPPVANGWRSRETDPGLLQEPNTLNIPAEARPAELPPAATVDKSPQAEKYQRIAERGERTGFKGFCPVALKDQLELADAMPQYRSEFEGQFYYFSNAVNLELFENDPLRYVPAQRGIDLVKYIQDGTEEPGRLDFAVWYQDRLFLFSNQQTLETFRAQPSQFVGGKEE